MSDLAFINDVITELRTADCDARLKMILQDICVAIGFDHFALIHHADLSRPAPYLIHIDTYPAVWRDQYVRKRVYVDDPVLHACVRTHIGFTWRTVSSIIRLSSYQRTILESACREGLGEGCTVPFNIPGEINGSCSFATRRGRSLPSGHLVATQLVGAFAFRAARRIRGLHLARAHHPRPELTERQRECVVLAGNGKTDWEIAKILGLREDTVTKYLNAARERYGVARRMQLVIAAVYDGQISLTELQCPLRDT